MMVDVEKRRKELDAKYPVWQRKTLARHFDDQAKKYGERVIIETPEKRLTYREAQRLANEAARGLIALGVKKREHVALLMGNSTEFVVYKLAIAKIGAVCIPVNAMLRQDELAFLLKHSDASVLIMNDRLGHQNYVSMMHDLCPELAAANPDEPLSLKRMPLLRRIVTVSNTGSTYPGMISEQKLWQYAAQVTEEERRRRQNESEFPDDISDIIYTSGTTGEPKGAMLSHDMFLRCSFSSVYTRAYPDGYRFITGLPMYHVFAYVEGFMTATFVGGTLVLLPQFSPREMLQMIEKSRANYMLGVPSMCIAIMNHPELKRFDLSSLSGVFCAAANAPATLWQRFKEELGVSDIATAYGMTEVSASATMTMVGDSIERVATTIGALKVPCVAGYEELGGRTAVYKVVDVDTGEELPPGKEGELLCRGPQVTRGYYKKPLETAEALDKDGWLRTGDLGVMNEDGYFCFTGRRKEMYKTSGENVSPKSVEDVISTHPAVSQVHVVGIPDPMLGEAGVACIELKEGMEVTRAEIIKFCRERMAKYKVPRHVVFMKAHEFPMTSTGKVQKFRLVDMMNERFNVKHA